MIHDLPTWEISNLDNTFNLVPDLVSRIYSYIFYELPAEVHGVACRILTTNMASHCLHIYEQRGLLHRQCIGLNNTGLKLPMCVGVICLKVGRQASCCNSTACLDSIHRLPIGPIGDGHNRGDWRRNITRNIC